MQSCCLARSATAQRRQSQTLLRMQISASHDTSHVVCKHSYHSSFENCYRICKMDDSFHYSILERLGIGWRDSVCQSNEKRVREYDRQLEEALQRLGDRKNMGPQYSPQIVWFPYSKNPNKVCIHMLKRVARARFPM